MTASSMPVSVTSFHLDWLLSTSGAQSASWNHHLTIFLHFFHVEYPVFHTYVFLYFDLFPRLVSKDGETITHYLEYLIKHSLPEQSRLLTLRSVWGSVEFRDWKILG